jgi:hypothetical protein
MMGFDEDRPWTDLFSLRHVDAAVVQYSGLFYRLCALRLMLPRVFCQRTAIAGPGQRIGKKEILAYRS